MPTFRKGEVSALPVWLDRAQLLAKQQRAAAELVLDTGNEAPNKTFGSRAGDERAMRGVPILGSGVGGAIAGSRPDGIAEREDNSVIRLLAA